MVRQSGSSGSNRGFRARRNRPADGLRVAVLMGGQSAEHDVSLTGGAAAMDALADHGYRLRPVVISREGRWRMPKRAWQPVVAGGGDDGPGFDPHDQDGWREFETATAGLEALRAWPADVVLPVLHGRFGEDGGLQACLDAAGIAYVGSGMRGSAVAFDKVRTKEVLAANEIDTPDYEVVSVSDLSGQQADTIQEWEEIFGYPFVIKDPLGGSSLEVRCVHDAGEAASAIDELSPGADRLLVEEFVEGRELTVGVLEDRESGAPKALPVVEIRPKPGRLFDYQEKYADDGAEELCPAPLDPDVAALCQEIGERVHALLGLRGLSRTDLLLAEDGTPYVLEVNTLPGMTSRGLVPLAASHAGLSFAALLEALLRTARTGD